jgi:Tol biopolymer transport system component/C-terminal processing protease CtpA/Prc
MKKSLALIAAGMFVPMSALAVTPLWLRDVQISPDGSQIAFCYKGDVWKVAAAGGSAVRLTTQSSYECNPIWSPDGSKIAFASDRHGNFDVYVMDANGGQATRLTFNSSKELPETFSPDGKDVYFSAAIQDPASSAMFPSARMTELYAVPVAGGASRQILGTPAQTVNFGNGFFLYQDIKGFEDEWRKHHTSSVTRDIWRYDLNSGKHTNITAHAGEDRNPIVNGDKFYFLSERNGGTMNVYQASLSNASQVSAVTDFKTHPVRFLSRGANGLLCFTYDGEIYTQAPGAQPSKVKIDLIDDDEADIEKMGIRSVSESAPSPDGKSIAFISRGEVFVTSVEFSTTKQITKTAEAESYVSWAPDGKALYYTSQRDGKYNIYKAEMARPDDEANFANATTINETAVFKADGQERMQPVISPDGKQMAFVLDRNKLMVMDLASKNVRQLTDGSMNATRTGGLEFSWSPDSKWILISIDEKRHYPYADVALLNVASGEITNLTNSGYTTEGARWAMDGNAIMFATEQFGMRNHASWGSQDDVMLLFVNQDAYDKYKLSEEDYAIRKDLEKKEQKDKADSGSKDKAKTKGKAKDADKDSDKDKKSASKDINVELDGITERVVRLTPMSTSLRDAIITADGENLYYIAQANNGTQLWKLDLRKGDHKMVTKLDGASGFDTDKDGSNIFILGKKMNKLDPKSDKLTPITYSATMTVDHNAERLFMFDYMAREEGERFYNKNMHGVDWKYMTEHYRQFMPHINNNYDFAELLSEILGELNVSHTGGRYSAYGSAQGDYTASLGLIYDLTYTGDGLKVDEIVEGGPFNNAKTKLAKGMIIEKINGEQIKAGEDYNALLCDIIGTKTLIGIYDPSTNKHWDEVVLPISASAQQTLLYKRWVRQRQADVEKWSNGRLGYVHIASMADDSFRTLYSDVLGKYNDCEGIVIDIRWNGGGRMHEDIEVMFSGQKYLTQEVRGVDICDMPSRRWNKSSIMLMSEACYSNAHGTPWVYKHQGIGKLVGAPVPGTMTSVNWVTMQDPAMVFGIPVVGYRTAEGTYLENAQLEPDVYVLNSPETVVKGEDTQLRTAVETLLKDLDANKK